jgi:hypothetical protein
LRENWIENFRRYGRLILESLLFLERVSLLK